MAGGVARADVWSPTASQCGEVHSNLREIGLAIQMYANANHGRFPDDFATLLRTQDLTPEVFVCPVSENDRTGHQRRGRRPAA